MTSPIIDEEVMLDSLKQAKPEELPEHFHRLRSGAALLLLDAYDRKATREGFISAIGVATGLVDAIARYSMMRNIKDFHDARGVVTAADIELTLSQTISTVQACTEQSAALARLVTQCPTDEDKVN